MSNINKRKNLEIIKEVISLYQIKNLQIKEIVQITQICSTTISRILKDNNIHIKRENKHNKKWNINENFFEVVNTPEKAYFLGFIYADGNVCLRTDSYHSTFNINLQEKDKDILEKFRLLLGSNKPLRIKSYENPNYQKAFILDVCNKKICQDLIKLGCIPAKSLTLKFPTSEQVPQELIHHFIRGYFDGDGCVCFRNKKTSKIFIQITSTLSFLEKLQDYLNIFEIKSRIGKTKSKAFTLVINNCNDSYKFADIIYSNKNNFFLERKYNKFIESKSKNI